MKKLNHIYCLVENIKNEYIDEIHLLNSRFYDVREFEEESERNFGYNKIHQVYLYNLHIFRKL